MNTLSKKIDLNPGTIIKGRWNNKEYNVMKILGSGENGIVYLVQYMGNLYALKMSLLYLNLDYEIGIMKKLNGAQGTDLGPKILDIDDFNYNGNVYFFYVMNYEKGISIGNYLNGKTANEYLYIFKKIIELLALFHQKGWVFGDIKPEHILINPNTKKVTMIDYGGVTRFNEGVRQFTEIFDRGNWKINNRKANAHYDLFSLAMVFIQISLGINEFQKIYNEKRRIIKVCDIIQNIDSLKYLHPIIKGVLLGRLSSAAYVLEEINYRNFPFKQKIIRNNWINYMFTAALFLFIVVVVLFLKTEF